MTTVAHAAQRDDQSWNYYCFKSRSRSGRGDVIQSDVLKIHNFVENGYQYDIMELSEERKALT